MTSARPHQTAEQRPPEPYRVWRTADGVHIDLRGLPEPMAAILQTIESGGVNSALIGHFDGEPIDLSRHEIETEVKAITWHELKIVHVPEGLLAEVIVDI